MTNRKSNHLMKTLTNQKPTEAQSQQSQRASLVRDCRCLAWTIVATLIAAIAVGVANSLVGQETESADPALQPPRDEVALAAFLDPWSAQAALEKNPEFLAQGAVAAFSIHNPGLANQIRTQDPAVREADAYSAFTILNPRAIEAERRKDPAWRQYEEAALEALRGGSAE